MNARSSGPSRYSVFSPIGAVAVASHRTVVLAPARRFFSLAGALPAGVGVGVPARAAKQSSMGRAASIGRNLPELLHQLRWMAAL